MKNHHLALVGIGGAIGAAGRYLITELSAPLFSRAAATFMINIAGSFLLGLLLQYLICCGPDVGRRRSLRLLLGTGVLGGFTTYSTLALDAQELLRAGKVLQGIGYGLSSVLIGMAAAALGIWLAGLIDRRRRPDQSRSPS